MTGDSEDERSRPVLKLIKGNATEEELAALLAVLAAVGSGIESKPKRPAPAWSAHHRKVRVTHRHGRGGWRSSGLPR